MRRRRPLENGTLMPSFLDGNMVSRVEELERTARALERLGFTTSAAAGAYERRYLLHVGEFCCIHGSIPPSVISTVSL